MHKSKRARDNNEERLVGTGSAMPHNHTQIQGSKSAFEGVRANLEVWEVERGRTDNSVEATQNVGFLGLLLLAASIHETFWALKVMVSMKSGLRGENGAVESCRSLRSRRGRAELAEKCPVLLVLVSYRALL